MCLGVLRLSAIHVELHKEIVSHAVHEQASFGFVKLKVAWNSTQALEGDTQGRKALSMVM